MFIHMLILSENVEYTSQEETWKIIKNDRYYIAIKITYAQNNLQKLKNAY